MYLPPHFAETRSCELHRILREHPLGMLVTHTPAGLDAHHLPFDLDAEAGSPGVLRAHIARANPLVGEITQGMDVLIVFRGAQGYISPNWYPGKHETHRHVPTWNYEVVHAHGRLNLVDDERFVRALLARLTRSHESTQAKPWKMGDAPADYLDAMLKLVVGVEVELTRLEGKRKLSQNREPRDVEGVVQGLRERSQDALAAAMTRTRS